MPAKVCEVPAHSSDRKPEAMARLRRPAKGKRVKPIQLGLAMLFPCSNTHHQPALQEDHYYSIPIIGSLYQEDRCECGLLPWELCSLTCKCAVN